MNAKDLAELADITYRQLDLWTNAGYLKPEPRQGDRAGYPREYPESEVHVARAMGIWVRLGMSPTAAAVLARGDEGALARVRAALRVSA